MRTLKLYERPEPLAVDQETSPLPLDPGCTRCELRDGVKSVCLAPTGEGGGLVVVGEAPGKNEDLRAKPFCGASGQLIRDLVNRWWKGPAVFDNAVRCFPGADGPSPKQVAACRPYLSGILNQALPTRIVCVGATAALGVLGRAIAPMSTRRGYSYRVWSQASSSAQMLGGDGASEAIVQVERPVPIPVFTVLHPAAALRNRFVRNWFEADLQWALTENPPLPPWEATVELVEDEHDAMQAATQLMREEWFSFDHETAGVIFDPSFRILCTALSTGSSPRRTFVWTKRALANPAARSHLVELLASPAFKKTGANVKYDMTSTFATDGVMPRGVIGDVRLQRRMLDPEAAARLGVMAELVGMGGHKGENEMARIEAVKGIRKALAAERRVKKKGLPTDASALQRLGVDESLESVVRSEDYEDERWSFALVPDDILYRYCARDAFSTAELSDLFAPAMVAQPQIKRVWDRIVVRASSAISQVEAWGIAVDRQRVLDFDLHLSVRQAAALQYLDGEFPGVNWQSPPQIKDILFKKLGLPVIKLTDTGQESTDHEVLEELRDYHPLVSHLIDLRKMVKLRGTYAHGMLRHIRADGRAHPSILLDGARSGRTSSQDPNIQNIPSEKKDPILGKMARDIFVAPPGYVLLSADYSQLELRVAAMLSGDPTMVAVFVRGEDIHQKTAELVSQAMWGIPPEKVTKEHRSKVKPIVFGVLYGKGDEALAKELGTSKAEAGRYRESIMGRYNKLDAWCKARLAESRLSGEAWTWWDGEKARRRHLWKIADKDDLQKSVAEHSSWNTPVQGTASDYCIASLVETVEWIRNDAVPAKVVAPVHDQLLLEVREDAVAETAWAVRRIMEGQPRAGGFDVPIIVDVECGPSWGSLVKYNFSPCG